MLGLFSIYDHVGRSDYAERVSGTMEAKGTYLLLAFSGHALECLGDALSFCIRPACNLCFQQGCVASACLVTHVSGVRLVAAQHQGLLLTAPRLLVTRHQ